ncbi:MAG: hypothetical protein ACEQR5_09995, partial [Moraxellaceae bacterium]
MRLEHDLITDSGIVPATKGRHAIYCLTVIGTIEGHSLAPDNQKSTKYAGPDGAIAWRKAMDDL